MKKNKKAKQTVQQAAPLLLSLLMNKKFQKELKKKEMKVDKKAVLNLVESLL